MFQGSNSHNCSNSVKLPGGYRIGVEFSVRSSWTHTYIDIYTGRRIYTEQRGFACGTGAAPKALRITCPATFSFIDTIFNIATMPEVQYRTMLPGIIQWQENQLIEPARFWLWILHPWVFPRYKTHRNRIIVHVEEIEQVVYFIRARPPYISRDPVHCNWRMELFFLTLFFFISFRQTIAAIRTRELPFSIPVTPSLSRRVFGLTMVGTRCRLYVH